DTAGSAGTLVGGTAQSAGGALPSAGKLPVNGLPLGQ
ncbi:ATP-binding protein, partial [Streptomyces sp. SID10853]|nr:ATP-binding protein [Streptomyces sp. SID10853]